MSTFAVTGAASGMGQQAAAKLRRAGHTVIGVDLHDADVVADLSTPEGRRAAADGVLRACGGTLDGAVLAAGIGPGPGREEAIPRMNYLGVVELLEAWRPALAEAGNAKVVVFSSAGSTITPLVRRRTIRAVQARNVDKAVRSVRMFRGAAPPIIYGAAKAAVSLWVRRNAVRPEWAGAGIRLNAIAPGAIRTPMLESLMTTEAERKRIEAVPAPIGGMGDASQIGDWVVLMLSDAADYMTGTAVFVDGGSDAYFRPTAWPTPVPMWGLLGYLRRVRAFDARR